MGFGAPLDVIGHVTIWFPRCHFLYVLYCNRVSISNHFWDNGHFIYVGHDLDLSTSREVISHMTNQSAICHFLLVFLVVTIGIQHAGGCHETPRRPHHLHRPQISRLLTWLLVSGAKHLDLVFVRMEDTSDTVCELIDCLDFVNCLSPSLSCFAWILHRRVKQHCCNCSHSH